MKDNMEAFIYFALFLVTFTAAISLSFYSDNQSHLFAEPLINLTVENKPLGDVLETIFENTDYDYHLDESWEEYPVTATLHGLPLEQTLKQLLRNLNHSIIWESNNFVTIVIVEDQLPGGSIATIPHEHSDQFVPEETEPIPNAEEQTGEDTEPVDGENILPE